jgi:hypothetical protein
MKVGVLQFFSWSRRIPLTTVYERAFERIKVMDQTGYDCVWLAEHHFNTYSVCPSINVMGAHVASITRNLRIGLAVSLAAAASTGAPGGASTSRSSRPSACRPRRAPTAFASASRSCWAPGGASV